MLKVLSIPEAKELVSLCKLGRLFEVQDWIGAGKSLSVPGEVRLTPLQVALGNGFYSLVQVLLKEADQETKNRALGTALSTKRLDLIDLLISSGAEVKSVPFVDVLMIWDPAIIRYFIDRGADLITDQPFATAFAEKIRTSLSAWRECKKKYPEFAVPLQEQADCALRYFCFNGDLKWVALLKWMGADPRSRGPKWGDYDDHDLEPDEYSSAMEHAAYRNDVAVLKQLKPDAANDDLSQLLSCAATFNSLYSAKYLLALGAKPNDKPNGGSTALSQSLCSGLGYRSRSDYYPYRNRVKAPSYAVSATLEIIRMLLNHNAQWRPDDADEIKWVRRHLYECEPEVTFEVMKQLVRHAACSQETIQALLKPTAMREHLTPVAPQLARFKIDAFTRKQKAEVKRQEKARRENAILRLARQYDRERIYDEIWSEAIQTVAKRYNLSDVGLAKICRKLKIPRPGRGYWAKKAAGKRVTNRPRLPALL